MNVKKPKTRAIYFQGEESELQKLSNVIVKFSERRKIHNKFPWIKMGAEIRPYDASGYEVQLGIIWEFPPRMSESAISSFMRKVNRHIARKLVDSTDSSEKV